MAFVESDSLRQCSYKGIGCGFEAKSDEEMSQHMRFTENQRLHLDQLATSHKELRSLVDVTNKNVEDLDNNYNNIRLAVIGLLKASGANHNQDSGYFTDSKTSLATDQMTSIFQNEKEGEQPVAAPLEKLLYKFPMVNAKMFHFLFMVQKSLKDLQEDFTVEKEKSKDLEREVESLRKMLANQSGLGLGFLPLTLPPTEKNLKSFENDSDSGMSEADSLDITETSSGDRDSNDKLATLEKQVAELQQTCKELKDDRERCKQLERFVMHLHERIKSLDCGRTGCFIWKITGFHAIFDNAQRQHKMKLEGNEVVDTAPCDFCSPLFYTGTNGYLMYMRLYPYGCDSAAGSFVSLFIALSPGEYDGVLKWPFKDSIEISMLSQDESGEKWTQTITPGGNNLTCFQRPSSKSGNMSVGILHFLIHKKIYTSNSPYYKNDTIYIEVKIRGDTDSSCHGPPKAKAARSNHH